MYYVRLLRTRRIFPETYTGIAGQQLTCLPLRLNYVFRFLGGCLNSIPRRYIFVSREYTAHATIQRRQLYGMLKRGRIRARQRDDVKD